MFLSPFSVSGLALFISTLLQPLSLWVACILKSWHINLYRMSSCDICFFIIRCSFPVSQSKFWVHLIMSQWSCKITELHPWSWHLSLQLSELAYLRHTSSPVFSCVSLLYSLYCFSHFIPTGFHSNLFIAFICHLIHLLLVWSLPFPNSRAPLVAQTVKRLPVVQETRVWSLGRDDPLEKEMVTQNSLSANFLIEFTYWMNLDMIVKSNNNKNWFMIQKPERFSFKY